MIRIDRAHCDLIYGLVVSAKPKNVLEIGLGEGNSAAAIQMALRYNGSHNSSHDIVDNWHDWQGQAPLDLIKRFPEVRFFPVDESTFCKELQPGSYDFILSDGDHANAEKNAIYLFSALRTPGILIFHDVTNPGWPNLNRLVHGYSNSVVFSSTSREDEECDRGLLVIFK